MKRMWMVMALWVVLAALPRLAWSQYNLEEVGIAGGPGFAYLKADGARALGPGGGLHGFFSHYACGKGYGFHLTAGANALFPSSVAGEDWLDQPISGKTSLQLAGLDLGALGKLRIHEYHRPREFAFLLGPKFFIPLLAHVKSETGAGGLGDYASSVNRFWVGGQFSIQIRRPAPEKKSWFIHPGVEYYFLPAFGSDVAGGTRPLYVFLHFGYAFWDQRG